MNILKITCRFQWAIIVLLYPIHLYGQPASSSQSDNIYQLVNQKYGIDEILVSGKYFENLYVNDLGHPYFLEDEYKKGYLVIHNQKFENLRLKYNIWEQTIVVQYTDNSDSQTAFIPPFEFISEFIIDVHKFKKYSFENVGEHFFEELYMGEINCLCLWTKDRDKSEHNVTFMAHKFSEPHKKFYLVIDEKAFPLKNKSTLIALFPDHKKEITQYLKAHKIKLYKSPDEKIAELIAWCESLSN
jgi:hypothetical protein